MSSQEQNILDVAVRLITNDTNNQFTMDQLVAETAVSRATIYRRFGSKEGLLKRLAAERGIAIDSLETPDARTRIKKAASVVCRQYGILNATMEQIAAEANVGVATVYRHFGDKESLIRAFIEEESPHKLIRAMTLKHDADIETNLHQIVTEMLIFLKENQDFLRMTFVSNAETYDYLAKIREAPSRTLHRLATFFETEIAAGHLKAENPQDMAAALLGMSLSFGVILPTFYDDAHSQSSAETARFIVRLFLEGVRTGDSRDNS